MDTKIIAILRKLVLLNWPYVEVKLTNNKDKSKQKIYIYLDINERYMYSLLN